MAMEQRNRQFLLERAHLSRHRRLRQPKLFAGMGETSRLSGGVKDLELIPVHDRVLGGWRRKSFRRHARLGLAVRGEELFRLQSRHAAESGSGNGLSVDIVGDV